MGSKMGPDWIEPAERIRLEKVMLGNIKASMPRLDEMLEKANDEWAYEDGVYRFYHQSFKVYALQQQTQEIVALLQTLLPNLAMNKWFMEIVKSGTGKVFKDDDNAHWLEVTRPIIEAFLHARYFLEMICKYGKQLDEPQNTLPSGWAAVLYLFNIR